MKFLPLLALLFAQSPSPAPPPALVHILDVQTEFHGPTLLFSGEGKGNLKDVDGSIRGFDFVFENCRRFQQTIGGEAYKATPKDNHTLLIQMVRIGSDAPDFCTLKVTYHSYVFTRKDGQLTTRPMAETTAQAN